MAWTTPLTWTAGELVTAAIMNAHVRDNENAILGGLVGVGFTELDLLGTGSAPAASAAGHATMYYDTVQQALLGSLNGGPYTPVGSPIYMNPFIISRWRDIVRS